METMKKSIFIISILIFVVLLYFITHISPSQTKNMRIAYVPTPSNLLVMTAYEKGYFSEEGLNVSLIPSEKNIGVNILLSKNADVATYVPLEPIINIETRQPNSVRIFKTYVVNENMSVYFLAVNKNSTIRSLSDLKNKVIAVQDIKGYNYLLMKNMLKTVNLAIDDITLQEIPTRLMEVSLITGSIDAAIMSRSYTKLAESHDSIRILDSNVIKYVVIPFPSVMMVIDKEHLDKNPESVNKIRNALSKAVEFNEKNKEDAAKILAKYMNIDLSTATFQTNAYLELWTDPDFTILDKYQNIIYDAGIISTKINMSELII